MDASGYKIIDCAGGIVVNDKDQVAIIFMADMDVWDFPKGGVEDGEDFFDAAKREVREEVGVEKMVFVKKLPIYSRPASNGKPFIMSTHMYLFKTSQEKIGPSAKDDVTKAVWVDKKDVISKLSLEGGVAYFKKILEEL